MAQLASAWLLGVSAPVTQSVEHQAVTQEVESSTLAGPSLKVFK